MTKFYIKNESISSLGRSAHCVKYVRIRVSLTCIFPYKYSLSTYFTRVAGEVSALITVNEGNLAIDLRKAVVQNIDKRIDNISFNIKQLSTQIKFDEETTNLPFK